MALPQTDLDIGLSEDMEFIEERDLPTKTFLLDFEKGECTQTVEGELAMEQAVRLALATVRYAHLIYSDEYGFENMIGYNKSLVEADLPRRIREALQQDDRVVSVDSVRLEFDKDNVTAEVKCTTIYGESNLLIAEILQG